MDSGVIETIAAVKPTPFHLVHKKLEFVVHKGGRGAMFSLLNTK